MGILASLYFFISSMGICSIVVIFQAADAEFTDQFLLVFLLIFSSPANADVVVRQRVLFLKSTFFTSPTIKRVKIGVRDSSRLALRSDKLIKCLLPRYI